MKDIKRTEDGYEPNMAINYISHYVLTDLLMPLLVRGPVSSYGTRIINVSSASFYAVSRLKESEFFQKHWFERFAPYARSKFANVLHTLELARRLKSSSHVTVNCMEPGMVKTDIY